MKAAKAKVKVNANDADDGNRASAQTSGVVPSSIADSSVVRYRSDLPSGMRVAPPAASSRRRRRSSSDDLSSDSFADVALSVWDVQEEAVEPSVFEQAKSLTARFVSHGPIVVAGWTAFSLLAIVLAIIITR